MSVVIDPHSSMGSIARDMPFFFYTIDFGAVCSVKKNRMSISIDPQEEIALQMGEVQPQPK